MPKSIVYATNGIIPVSQILGINKTDTITLCAYMNSCLTADTTRFKIYTGLDCSGCPADSDAVMQSATSIRLKLLYKSQSVFIHRRQSK
ncbi:MAG: hypothetical protein IPP29_08135 [Bacteroidetes bacterium]|nr:hypothetical protein [Bacteroidota bacterium]